MPCARSSIWSVYLNTGSGLFLLIILCCGERPKIQEIMEKFSRVVERRYHLFEYVGAPDAKRVIVMMGSGAETAHETVEHLNRLGDGVGLLKVRLYRPFSVRHFLK